jgi:hypothetical protein
MSSAAKAKAQKIIDENAVGKLHKAAYNPINASLTRV